MTSIKQHQQKNADAREANRAEMITSHCLLARERKYWGGGNSALFIPPTNRNLPLTHFI